MSVASWQLPAVVEDDHLGFSGQAAAVATAEAIPDPSFIQITTRQVEGLTITVTHDDKNGDLVIAMIGVSCEAFNSFCGHGLSQTWHWILSGSLG